MDFKQASKSQNIKFDRAITSIGFENYIGGPCFYKRIKGKKVVFLILYIDNILWIVNDKMMSSSVKGCLHKQINMKDAGEANYILGIKLFRD